MGFNPKMPEEPELGLRFWLCAARDCVTVSAETFLIGSRHNETLASATMNLDESQRKKVAEWISQGLKLSEIQNRLNSELGARMTYMEVRLLVDDLKLTPKDIEIPKPVASPLTAAASQPGVPVPAAAEPIAEPEAVPAAGGVSVTVDHLARPGALVSGKVTFSDGNRADWYLDQSGRLGLAPQKQGYRPPASDVQQFQVALEAELSKLGL
jgi:hypothetical protein